jgi:hypothetical protein
MNLEKASEHAIKYSKLTSMAELKKEYKMEDEPMIPTAYGIYAAPMAMSMGMSKPKISYMPRTERSVAGAASFDAYIDPVKSSEPATVPVEENYTVASDEINYQQSERLVQKILNRKK